MEQLDATLRSVLSDSQERLLLLLSAELSFQQTHTSNSQVAITSSVVNLLKNVSENVLLE